MEYSTNNFITSIIDDDLEHGRVDYIQTRFPPEPNGYMHIGHAKAIYINFSLAQKYGGKCNLRYDDTNPVKEDIEYVRGIEEDIRWLGFSWNKLLWASDYFETMYNAAIDLIKKGKAYVDNLTVDEIKQYRGTLTTSGKESECRNQSIEENLELFEAMKNGMFADGERVLRAKIDMSSPNINLRDPVIYRISHEPPHHNTGRNWCIYPMYDFAHPIEDAIEGVTHSLCSLEFEDHRPLYNWVLDSLGWWKTKPQQIEFARLNLTNTVMSKRYLRKFVEEEIVDGWDDPRMPTIAGLRRRGYTPKSIRDFCERIGVAKTNSVVDIALLEHCIREDLKGIAPCKNVVENPIKVIIDNYPSNKSETIVIENNRENSMLGTREITFSNEIYIDGADFMEIPEKKYYRLYPGNEVRLKGAYFITCKDVVKNSDGSIKELHCTYDPKTKSGSNHPEAQRKVKGTIHFVDAKNAVKIKIRNFDYLMKLDEQGKYVINENSVQEVVGYGEQSINQVTAGERVQFFRHGYYILDEKLCSENELVFNKIVDLKSSWK